jgi:hypothetical protein
LYERKSIDKAMQPEEVYEKFVEHMRFQDVNEITALRDLEYAQNSKLSGKQRFGRLIDAYDKVNEDVSGRMMWDYASGVLTAPSTYVGLVTGGTGKLASMAGTQAAKLGVRKILSEGLKSSSRAAMVEGAIGAGQGAVQEGTRVETGIQEKFDGVRTLQSGLASAATAGILNFPVGIANAKRASKANELFEQAQIANAAKANTASKKSKDVLKTVPKQKIKEVRETLDALDPTKVKIGRLLKQDLSPGTTMTSALGAEVVENISAAAIRVKDKLKVRKNERVTSAVARLISDGNETVLRDVASILDEHNLTPDQFSLVYLAEISEAGATLGSQSRISKALKPKLKTTADKMIDDLDQLEQAGKSAFSAQDAVDLSKGLNIIRDLDSARLGLMTSQPATTMRNNFNGGFRVAVDAATRIMDNGLNARNPFDGAFDVAKYLFNPYEAKVMQQLFSDAMPETAAKLFREAADINAKTPSETVLATVGRKVNVLNTMSDNMFKRAVLSASLKRRLSDNGLDLYDIISKGEWNKIDDEIMQKSIQDAYEFTYQSDIKGDGFFATIGKGTLNFHRQFPFAVSSFMPFPRYIANQMKFVNEHMPLIGLMQLDRLGAKTAKPEGYLKERLAKQLTGTGMLSMAYLWRAKQGETEYWYDIKTNDNNTIDGRAVYGPFAPFMLVADLIYRYQKGTMPTSIGTYIRDTTQALLGSTFRAGLGLYTLDQLYQDAASGKSDKIIGETLGNIINTYTIPVSVVKDFYGQFDPQSRKIPETSPALEGRTTNWFDIMMRRGTRAFPDFPVNGYDTAALSPFQTGDLTAVHPIEKQLFGFGMRKGKNKLQQEMAKLNLTPYDLYKRSKNDTLDLYTRQELSEENSELNLNERMKNYIESDDYKIAGESTEEKRLGLVTEAQEIIGKAREVARKRIGAEDSSSDRPYNELDLMDFQNLSSRQKQALNAEYQREYNGESIMGEKDLTMIVDGKYINVMTWAASRAREIR